jgi:uncharacterized membrane protein YjdF
MTPSTTPPNLLLITTGLLLVILLAFPAGSPYDRATWLMEVAPIMVALPILVATRQRFPLTSLLYACIFIHALILMLGRSLHLRAGTTGLPTAGSAAPGAQPLTRSATSPRASCRP